MGAQHPQHFNSYQDALDFLNGKPRRTLKASRAKTWAQLEDNGDVTVWLHETAILTIHPNNTVTLDNGGWPGPTTKARMNDYLPDKMGIHQAKHIWYLSHGYWNDDGRWEVPYANGMVIDLIDLSVQGAASQEDIDKRDALIKSIKKYAKGYVKALLAGDVPQPSEGDCLICRGIFGAGGDGSCLISHIDELYYVPTLLFNAREFDNKMSQLAESMVGYLMNGEDNPLPSHDEWLGKQVEKTIVGYMEHHLLD